MEERNVKPLKSRVLQKWKSRVVRDKILSPDEIERLNVIEITITRQLRCGEAAWMPVITDLHL
jgi:hypothetical protein